VSKKCSKEGPSSVPSKKKRAQVSNVCAPPIFIIDPQFGDFYRNSEIGDETELGNGIG